VPGSLALVTTEVDALLGQGEAALAAGDWPAAATCFGRVLKTEDRPDAHYGLATAL
jgi:hypothetical protein